jgi:hypothetical protein
LPNARAKDEVALGADIRYSLRIDIADRLSDG